MSLATVEPVLLAVAVPCDTCGSLTFWRAPRQRTRGRCMDHWVPDWPLSPAGMRVARDIVTAAFPGASVEVPEPPTRYRRGEYPQWTKRVFLGRFLVSREHVWLRGWGIQPDAGPCARCGHLIKAYGPDAYAVCQECEERR